MGEDVSNFSFYDKKGLTALRKLSPDLILEQVGDDIPDDVPASFKAYLEKKTTRTRARIKAIVLLYTGNITRLAKLVGICRQKVAFYLKEPAVREAIQDRHPQTALADSIADRDEILSRWTSIARDDRVDLKHRLKADELLGKASMMFVEKVIHEGGDKPITVHQADVSDRIANIKKGERKMGDGE